jgi:hypothetical protein
MSEGLTKFAFIEADDNTFLEIQLELHFVKALDGSSLNQTIEQISAIINGDISKELKVILAYLELSSDFAKLRFKYIKPKSPAAQTIGDEEFSRLMAQFLFYFVAKIDAKFPVKDGEMPPHFRHFLNLPAETNNYYGWNVTS